MRWPIAITIGFVILIAWNGVFVYLAVQHTDPVVESYHLEKR